MLSLGSWEAVSAKLQEVGESHYHFALWTSSPLNFIRPGISGHFDLLLRVSVVFELEKTENGVWNKDNMLQDTTSVDQNISLLHQHASPQVNL